MVILVLPRSCDAVVGEAPLAEFLVDDEGPLVGVGDVDEEGVVALGDVQVADHEVAVSVQRGGGVGSGAPYGIVRVMADEAISGEDFAFTAFHAG